MNNIFQAIPDDLHSEVFESLINSENVNIERIISKGHTSPVTGWHEQERNEWVLLLKGEATLLFADGTRVNLKAGDFIEIEADKKHRVEWTLPDAETIWLAVHY